MSQYNYVKAHRKRWNLTQAELGVLLGYGNNSVVSRIETGRQRPSLEELIFLELLFGKAASRLFPDVYSDMTEKLLKRMSLFEEYLCEASASHDNMEKLNLIRKLRNALLAANSQRL